MRAFAGQALAAPAAKPVPARPASVANPVPAPKPAAPGPSPLSAAIPVTEPKDALRRVLLKPYADVTGTELADPPWDGAGPDALKKTPADLVLLPGDALTTACRAQSLTKLDWGVLGRDRYMPEAVTECGAGAYVSATALAWDRDKLQAAPTWSDFWDVARHPGGRGLQHTVRGNLEIALLADGVSAGDVYRTLRSNDGVDRAFRKLDQLKPYIIWWDRPDQPAQLLSAGRVLLTSAPTGPMLQSADATHRAYGLQWAGSLVALQYWAVPQNAPHPDVAAAALLIVGDIARQAMFARATGLGPTIKGADALLPPAARAANPSTPVNAQGGLIMDEGFWVDNGDKLQARFAAWLAK
jgi:putative spermidine/putrescine transport system substrate-binding protein